MAVTNKAEVRRLARAFAPYGVLKRQALEVAAGSTGGVRVRSGSCCPRRVRSGVIEPRPRGFYKIPARPSD